MAQSRASMHTGLFVSALVTGIGWSVCLHRDGEALEGYLEPWNSLKNEPNHSCVSMFTCTLCMLRFFVYCDEGKKMSTDKVKIIYITRR